MNTLPFYQPAHSFWLFALLLCCFTEITFAQCFEDPPGSGCYVTALGEPCLDRVIITALPHLQIAPDARSAGMGEAGIAAAKDASILYYNPSRMVFGEGKMNVGANYVRGNNFFDTDTDFGNISGIFKWNDKNALGGTVNYFSTFTITDQNGDPLGKIRDWEMGLFYARRFGEHFSGGLGLKYLRSNLPDGAEPELTSGKSFATDISFAYQNPSLSIGLAIRNIGQAMTYTTSVDELFLPANLGLGVAWQKELGDNVKLALTADANKLLVPISDYVKEPEDYRKVSLFGGIWNSFSDAGCHHSEWQEIMFSFGTELWFRNTLALRGGYHYQHESQGLGGKYVTTGLGVRYRFLTLNASYSVPTTETIGFFNGKTFRVGLVYQMEEEEQ